MCLPYVMSVFPKQYRPAVRIKPARSFQATHLRLIDMKGSGFLSLGSPCINKCTTLWPIGRKARDVGYRVRYFNHQVSTYSDTPDLSISSRAVAADSLR